VPSFHLSPARGALSAVAVGAGLGAALGDTVCGALGAGDDSAGGVAGAVPEGAFTAGVDVDVVVDDDVADDGWGAVTAAAAACGAESGVAPDVMGGDGGAAPIVARSPGAGEAALTVEAVGTASSLFSETAGGAVCRASSGTPVRGDSGGRRRVLLRMANASAAALVRV